MECYSIYISIMIRDSVDAVTASYIPQLDCGIPCATNKTPWQLWVESDSSYIMGMTLQNLDQFACFLVPNADSLVVRATGEDVPNLFIEDHVEDSFLVPFKLSQRLFRVNMAQSYRTIEATHNVLVSDEWVPTHSKYTHHVIDATWGYQILIVFAGDHKGISCLWPH